MSTSGIKDEGDDESEIVQTTPEQEFSSKNELDQLDRQRTDSRDADVSERFTTGGVSISAHIRVPIIRFIWVPIIR